jgi:hypothetical protein
MLTWTNSTSGRAIRAHIHNTDGKKMGSEETISIPKETAVAVVEQGFCNGARDILHGKAIPYHEFKHKPVLMCPYCNLASLLVKENDASEVSGSSRNPERKAKE